MWSSIISAFKAVLDFIKYLLGRKDQERNTLDVIKKIHTTYSVMNELMKKSGASRVMVLKNENGGGYPRLGAPIYSSVLFEVYDSPLSSLRSDWQRQILDAGYISVLMKMLQEGKGYLRFQVSELEGMIRTVCRADHKKIGLIAQIHVGKKGYYYLMMGFLNDTEPTPTERAAVLFGITKLQQLFKEEE